MAVVIAAITYFFFFQPDKKEVKIETAVVKTSDITNVITATGTVEPITRVEVGTQVSGVIKKIYVNYNSAVKKGQLIAELDKTTLQANVTKLQASLNSAKNELEYQQRNYDRIVKLYEKRVVSETDYEQAPYQLTNANTIFQSMAGAMSAPAPVVPTVQTFGHMIRVQMSGNKKPILKALPACMP